MSNSENSKDTPVQIDSTVESNGSQTPEPSQVVQPQVAQQVEQPQTTQQIAQPQEVQQSIKKAPKKKKFGVFEWVIGALVVFGGGYSAINYFDVSPKTWFSGSSSGFKGGSVVVINTDILISAMSVEVMGQKNSQEKISILMEKVYQEIESYTKQGYVVLDSDTPILHAPQSDITLEVAKKIGLDAQKGFDIAKENKFIGNAGLGNLELQNKDKKPSGDGQQIEDYSNLDLNTNANGETMDLDY